MSRYTIDSEGFYGEFGGAFIPEMLVPNIQELQENYENIINSEAFKKEFISLLKNYVGRPSPLYYANNLSTHYNTTIFLKREDVNHTGSHKVNNTIGQVLIAKHLGKKYIIAETGAGQHGVATATVCALMNIKCKVFMGAKDVERQSSNYNRMNMLGAEVIPVTSGSKTLKDATNEALRYWIANPNAYYLIGSAIGPHPYPDMVTKLQSVIGDEIKQQLTNEYQQNKPNYVIACVGGGSNAAGSFYSFLEDEDVKLIGAEAHGKGEETGKSAATLNLGKKGVIHGCMTYLMQNKDGQIKEPYSISAGLDYPGIGPLHAHLYRTNRAQYIPVSDKEALKAAYFLTQKEGIIPALESAHALGVLEKLSFKKKDIVVVTLSGKGDKDIETYIKNSVK